MARIDDAALARFMATKAAWLMPDGSLLPATAILEHLSALRGTAFEEMVAACEREVEEIRDGIHETLAWESENDPDAHPAMHRFDGATDEPRERLVRDLYRAGLVRLGLGSGRRDGSPGRMEAEGLAEHVDACSRALAAAARKLGAELSIARYEVVPPRVRRGRVAEGESLARVPDGDGLPPNPSAPCSSGSLGSSGSCWQASCRHAGPS